MTARLLMVALDGADGGLLDRWSADGNLPNLAALRARGVARRLTAPPGITDDGLWASFQYASGLGEHGRYHYLQRLASGEMGMAFRDERDRDAFWDDLSAAGLRVAILDVPKCRMPRPLNGIHLADWLVHGRYFHDPQSYPPSLAADVVERFGPAPPSRCDHEPSALDDAAILEVAGNLRMSVARKRAAGLHYLASESWDLFVIGFKEAHCAGHTLWDLADPHGTGDRSSRAARLGDPVRAIFADLDAAVGDLVAAAEPDAGVVVFSTTDMAANATLGHLMPEVVHSLNRALDRDWTSRAAGWLSRRRVCELLPYNENCAAFRINARGSLLGRAPADGRKARILDQVEAALRALIDAETGKPVIAAITRPSAEFAGPRAAGLPDLLAHYAAGVFPRAVASPLLGRIEAERPPLRPGNHLPGGLLILAEQAVAAGRDVTSMQALGPLAATLLRTGA